MTFKENLNRICKEQGTKLTPVLKDLGYRTSKATAINNWNKNAEISNVRLQRKK